MNPQGQRNQDMMRRQQEQMRKQQEQMRKQQEEMRRRQMMGAAWMDQQAKQKQQQQFGQGQMGADWSPQPGTRYDYPAAQGPGCVVRLIRTVTWVVVIAVVLYVGLTLFGPALSQIF